MIPVMPHLLCLSTASERQQSTVAKILIRTMKFVSLELAFVGRHISDVCKTKNFKHATINMCSRGSCLPKGRQHHLKDCFLLSLTKPRPFVPSELVSSKGSSALAVFRFKTESGWMQLFGVGYFFPALLKSILVALREKTNNKILLFRIMVPRIVFTTAGTQFV